MNMSFPAKYYFDPLRIFIVGKSQQLLRALFDRNRSKIKTPKYLKLLKSNDQERHIPATIHTSSREELDSIESFTLDPQIIGQCLWMPLLSKIYTANSQVLG
jgi:hypothetical protein